MIDYKTYDELPRRVQYFVDTIKSIGYEDIRNFEYPSKYFGENSFGCKVWVDAEDTVRGIIPYRGTIQSHLDRGSMSKLFGIKTTSISVHYKNKQQLGKKFLPELKKRLKECSVGKQIHSVRFDIKTKNDDPEVFVVLRRGSDIECWGIIKKLLEDFKVEKGYPNLYVKIS